MSGALAICCDNGFLIFELRGPEGTQRLLQLPGGGPEAAGVVAATCAAAVTAALQAGRNAAMANPCPDCTLKAARAMQPQQPVIQAPNGGRVQ
jgi:hypothetical protein